MARYMVIEHFKNGDPVPVYSRFHDQGRLAPEGLTYVSSWVEEELGRCYQIMETEDPQLLGQWMANWSDLVDFEVHLVITSEEAAQRVNQLRDLMTAQRERVELSSLPGSALRWLHAAAPVFAEQKLKVENYRVAVEERGNEVIVSLTSGPPLQGIGSMGKYPNYNVIFSKKTGKILRAHYVR